MINLKQISSPDFLKKLSDHELWLTSDKKHGKQCDLSYVDLKAHDLKGKNLVKAKLVGADLRRVDLTDTNFEDADLSNANLQRAILKRTALFWAELWDADLKESAGLISSQLAGANVAGAKLDEDIAKFEAVKHADEAGRFARRIFLPLVAGCVYIFIALISASDAEIISNSDSIPLPFIVKQIPIQSFYLFSPLFLVAVFWYMQFYLNKMWETANRLPAFFPDGRPLDQILSPWLPNILIRLNVKKLKPDPVPLLHPQRLIVIILIWAIVPITLILIWHSYLIKHSLLSVIHIALFAISSIVGKYYYENGCRYLSGEPVSVKEIFKLSRKFVVRIIALALVMLGISFFAMIGNLGIIPTSLRYDLAADLVQAELSKNPIEWYQDSTNFGLIQGARLRGSNLRYSDATEAFLMKADLRESDITGMNIYYADLRLSRGLSRKMILSSWNWLFANYSESEIRILGLLSDHNTKKNTKNFSHYTLHDGVISNKLINANLESANFNNSTLQRMNLSHANLSSATFLFATLDSVNFSSADLTSTSFSKINRMNYIDFSDAIIDRTDFRGTKMTNIIGLTSAQVLNSKIDKNTVLPKYLADSLFFDTLTNSIIVK